MVTVSNYGQVTEAASELIAGLGPQGPAGALRCAALRTLAQAVDVEEDGAKLAALSRELRQMILIVTEVSDAPAHNGLASVSDLIEKANRKRAQSA